jgi:diguanylate cyclase (GGDEF)-like protein/PAS domain S-box-containing protein
MSHHAADHDQPVVENLRARAERVEGLERHIAELERELAQWRDAAQEPSRELALCRDSVQQQSRELEVLHRIKAEWEWFFDHSLDMLCIAGLDGYFKRVNPAFCRALGYEPEQLVARPLVDFVHPADVAATLATLEGLRANQDCIDFENRCRHANGEWRWIAWHCPAPGGTSTKFYAIARDVTERKRADSELLYKASHDPLTGLLNRAAFEEGLAQALRRGRRTPGKEIALYLVDLDGFKGVNDNYGHPAGDQALQQLAVRLTRVRREGELVCRLGGDEFAFVIEAGPGAALEPLAKRILETVEQPIELDAATVSLGCCIGIAVSPRDAHDSRTLVAHADRALYHVKKNGKRGFEVYADVGRAA